MEASKEKAWSPKAMGHPWTPLKKKEVVLLYIIFPTISCKIYTKVLRISVIFQINDDLLDSALTWDHIQMAPHGPPAPGPRLKRGMTKIKKAKFKQIKSLYCSGIFTCYTDRRTTITWSLSHKKVDFCHFIDLTWIYCSKPTEIEQTCTTKHLRRERYKNKF